MVGCVCWEGGKERRDRMRGGEGEHQEGKGKGREEEGRDGKENELEKFNLISKQFLSLN